MGEVENEKKGEKEYEYIRIYAHKTNKLSTYTHSLKENKKLR